jgi:hypothetical protein
MVGLEQVEIFHFHMPRHGSRTAHLITQPQKLHSQLLGPMTAVTQQVNGLTYCFFYGMGRKPASIIHNNFASDEHRLLFFHVRPAKQSTITDLDALASLKHVSFDTKHLYRLITPHSILNATQGTKCTHKIC